jgi:hypothetical protein
MAGTASPPSERVWSKVIGFAMLNPSYGTEFVGWVEHRETHHLEPNS